MPGTATQPSCRRLRLHSADQVRQRRHDEAADAWSRARTALAVGDLAAARFWLERVGRIAPDDPRPRFERALILAATGDDGAEAALATIARTHDVAAAWRALAQVRWRNGDHHGAHDALHTLLSRHETPTDPDFASFAAAVARASGHAFRPEPVPHATTGIVTSDGKAISGWVINRAAPEQAPHLVLVDCNGLRVPIRSDTRLDPEAPAWFLPRHQFRIGAARLRRLQPPLRIIGPDGKPLFGTPIDPATIANLAPIQARRRPIINPPRAPLCIVMPAYRNEKATRAALHAAYAATDADTPIIVIDDATPERDLSDFLNAEARAKRIILRRHRSNRGFPGAANAGIRTARKLRPGCDILLLNADVLVPPGAPARLHAALYASPTIASATPLSNEATILSYPSRQGGNPAPDLAATIALDRMARRANGPTVIEIPTAIGFCMAIRHDALAITGRLDETLFAQGYGEENDWCRRAAGHGFSHVAVPGIFVAHQGGASFGAGGAALCARNLGFLERRHPGYYALVAAHHEADPLRRARFRLDRARFCAGRGAAAIVLVSHDHGGGIARIIDARMATIRAQGIRPILVQPDFADPTSRATGIGAARLTDGAPHDYPNFCYHLPGAWRALVAFLRRQNIQHVEYHHTLGHHPLMRALAGALGVPAEHVIHDYAHFCKRVNLLGPARRYCGEPAITGCVICIETAGSELTDPIEPAALLARSSAELHAARQISAPSADAAARLRRHFPGIAITVTPWEDDTAPVTLATPPNGPRLIALVGGIGPAKGYDVLLDCARDAAARNLPLSFVLIGASENDAALIETGRVMITGPYQEGQAAGLITQSGAHLGFLPSIWPETWCFALSELWRAGLYVLGFDLGAQAARIKATGRGFLLPLGLPAARINQSLLAWRPDLGDLTRRIQPVITIPRHPPP